jgi:tetratricopeptide (TPR) repeat protein
MFDQPCLVVVFRQTVRRRRRSRIPRDRSPPGERRTISGLRISSSLGEIYRSKGETEKAIHHFEVALGIASPFNWHDHLFWVHYSLAGLFRDEGRFDDAQAHVEHAKSHTVNSAYNLGICDGAAGWVWYRQHRLEEARTEALRAADVYEKLGAAKDMERCQGFLPAHTKELNNPVASGQSTLNRELLYAY